MTTQQEKLDSAELIADVQSRGDQRNIDINSVGIKGLRHRITVRDRSGEQQSVADISMAVFLPHHYKGTHMSRFISILNETQEPVSIASFKSLLKHMIARLEAQSGSIEFSFPFFVNKPAPVSGIRSLMDYQVTLRGEISEKHSSMRTKVVVPVTSLCPCSKEISDYGAHNQRSHITLDVSANGVLFIEDLIDIAEKQASSDLYGVLKRSDEKYVTERAYDNPKFVEDVVRDIAAALMLDERIESFDVEVENFESIHNHSAYAQIKKE